jgi:glycosyltransferase involved in cell wall biosynthesis
MERSDPALTVVVPALDEASRIERCLTDLRREGGDRIEIIVVDGGSGDGTPSLAEPLADRVIAERGGFVPQLNRGAHVARARIILFHPADNSLESGAVEAIERSLEDPGVVGGAFRLELDSPRFAYRVISWAANVRAGMGVGPFSDQDLFVRADAFRRVGGFRTSVLLEDLDLVRRLRRLGRVAILPMSVRSSVRFWERHGVVRGTLSHWGFLALHHAPGGARVRDLYLRGKKAARERRNGRDP